MQRREEMQILLGNKGRYTNYKENDIFLNITLKYRQLSLNKCIVCAKYYLTCLDNNIKYWVIKFIIKFNISFIRDFLEEFGRNVIMTDEWYSACGLYHLMHFQNRLDQHDLDEARDKLDKDFRDRMASKKIFLLENEDMMTSKLDPSIDTEVPDIKRFRPEILTHEVCKTYFIIFNLTLLYYYI